MTADSKLDPVRRRCLQGTSALLATLMAGPGLSQKLEPLNPKLSGDLYPIHDPCIIGSSSGYYVFCTTNGRDAPAQIPCYHSTDLMAWKKIGHVFDAIPAWAQSAIPKARTLWAPDISFADGRYSLYYACSTFGSNRSVIGLATNTTLDPGAADYHWVDQGLVLESQKSDDFNALDPNRLIDRTGKQWLAFGSFWSGLKLIALDPTTAKPAPGAQRLSIARRPTPPDAIEGVFIIERAGIFYQFASFDFCCRGEKSNYYTVVGRAKDPTGPYVDRSGKSMLDGGGTVVLTGDPDGRWRGTGHIAILRDDNKDYIVYHAYDAEHEGRPTLRIAPLGWDSDNWPVAFT